MKLLIQNWLLDLSKALLHSFSYRVIGQMSVKHDSVDLNNFLFEDVASWVGSHCNYMT